MRDGMSAPSENVSRNEVHNLFIVVQGTIMEVIRTEAVPVDAAKSLMLAAKFFNDELQNMEQS